MATPFILLPHNQAPVGRGACLTGGGMCFPIGVILDIIHPRARREGVPTKMGGRKQLANRWKDGYPILISPHISRISEDCGLFVTIDTRKAILSAKVEAMKVRDSLALCER